MLIMSEAEMTQKILCANTSICVRSGELVTLYPDLMPIAIGLPQQPARPALLVPCFLCAELEGLGPQQLEGYSFAPPANTTSY